MRQVCLWMPAAFRSASGNWRRTGGVRYDGGTGSVRQMELDHIEQSVAVIGLACRFGFRE